MPNSIFILPLPVPYLLFRKENLGHGCWWGLTLGWWRVILRWAYSPNSAAVWRSRATLLTCGASSFPPGKEGWKRRTSDPHRLPMPSQGAHLGVVPRLPSP